MPEATKRPLPFATLAIIAASVVGYVTELAAGGMSVCQMFGFVPAHPSLSTALLSMWLHDPDHAAHIAGNVVVLAVVGAVAEAALGGWRMIALFVASGLGGAAMHWLVDPGSQVPLVGCSGALCGLMAVGAVARPRAMLACVVTFVALNVLGLYVATPLIPAGASVADHVGGFVVGAVVVFFMRAARVGSRLRLA